MCRNFELPIWLPHTPFWILQNLTSVSLTTWLWIQRSSQRSFEKSGPQRIMTNNIPLPLIAHTSTLQDLLSLPEGAQWPNTFNHNYDSDTFSMLQGNNKEHFIEEILLLPQFQAQFYIQTLNSINIICISNIPVLYLDTIWAHGFLTTQFFMTGTTLHQWRAVAEAGWEPMCSYFVGHYNMELEMSWVDPNILFKTVIEKEEFCAQRHG